MSSYLIYHNPRCSKSRQTLALLEERGIAPEIVLYLQTPPNAATLRKLVRQLGLAHPHALLRTGEAEYAQAGLSEQSSAAAVIDAMVKYPKLIERPIVVRGERAALGRPPENVLALLED